jgi:hypothetical protein
MSHEEKLEEAKRLYETANADQKYVLESLFPELAESKDERVRKDLIIYLRSILSNKKYGDKFIESWIAWLEKQSMPQVRTGLEWVNTIDDACDKRYSEEYAHGEYCHEQSFKWGFQEGVDWLEQQGEQKPIISNNALREGIAHFGITQYQIDNWLKKYIDVEKQGKQKLPIEKLPFEMKTPEESLGVDSDTYSKIVNECIYDEQKPTDKVEPKFKQGDWIIFNGLTLQVKGVVKGFYITTSKDGITNGYDWSIDNAARLWTIRDAKDGDVLVHNNCTFIFMGIKDGIVQAIEENILELVSFGEPNKDNDYHPATKEQRDTLLKAMADAGYTFDFDKKELKNIEQKSARCAWTERDEKQARQIERIVHNDGCSKKLQEQIANWFKSLKDRVQPQPKQEWSEEDKRRIDHIIAFISDKERIKDTERMFPIEEDIRWLKFLKDRYIWRPSDEQMETLKYACGGNYVDLGVLDSLYNDLKKLKGE